MKDFLNYSHVHQFFRKVTLKNIGDTFLGKLSFVWPMFPCWNLRQECGFSSEIRADFGDKNDISPLGPHAGMKIYRNFTTFMPKFAEICSESAVFSWNPWISVVFVVSVDFELKSVDFGQNSCNFQKLQDSDFGLWLSKVFLTKAQ